MIEDPWIPCVKDGGKRETLTPWQIFGNGGENEVLSLATPRPDFQGAVIQFLIGLVQTTMAPPGEDEWVDGLQSLPGAREVKQRFDAVSHAFNLGGDGPRFMQDTSCADVGERPIESLIIGMPGENTYEKNRDFFCKRNTIKQLCPSCAAMGLISLQLNGPQGGQGHRAGLRGGGPLTSVILGKSLPELIWLNVLPEDEFFIGLSGERKSAINDIFPWMGPLRTSEGGDEGLFTGISDASQLQMFWGTGRRILLGTEHTTHGTCDICGEATPAGITSLRTKNYGIRYDDSWRHVLTPYYRSEDTYLPVHLHGDGIAYHHWLGLVQNDVEQGVEVAHVVRRFRNIQANLSGILPDIPQLWAFGYDFKKVEARCWYESYMPLIRVENSIRADYEVYIAQIVRAAKYVNRMVNGAINDALYKSENKGASSGKKVKREKSPKVLSIVMTRFWSETETLFYSTLSEVKKALENNEPVDPIKRRWVMGVRGVGLNLFDFYSQAQYVDEHRPKAIIGARKKLSMTISPGSPKLMQILSLSKEAG
ncbi:MAG TPA: type I-E CRISPR-associated protein Cse1/CasA [Methanoregulaceae archaeon]|nr:MAG: type I-E CRISPR-associated protein Cse1/CasA [Methanolinea sp.]HON81886.1 type I-E CRISPR-associated protein Cse1/CasA [Methanoregulaceae archaeon]HPD10607.1 type I-E CRISPR-associated protein Cse1/CasA [Methanoregulaceae archaeon]HRT15739.1 type I-E CRISPR-associated protein Cse1/CasA [Methanoregulaceae archaeon]HRU31253.1 type I-E CRISPR-associated protein Cse1/CasA [Methanoregulaceae archaeon]